MTQTVHAADLFCGAGGTSTGLLRACERLELRVDLLAVNHWQTAIDTHAANHPHVRHVCASVESLDPRTVIPGGRLDLLVASPECTHFAHARGGRPVQDQKRASGWHLLRWLELLRVETVLIENVQEFRDWGPVGAHGKPLASRKGETYQAFLTALRSLGYRVEHRILNAADYGAAQSRKRLFIVARRGSKPIPWPGPTHAAQATFDGRAPWRPAREIIDWSLVGESLFARRRPLAPATMRRILAGLTRFGGPALHPFLVVLRNHAAARSLDRPAPALAANGQHLALVEPFVLSQASDGAPRGVSRPLPTIATKGAVALVEPFVLHVNHGDNGRESGRGNGGRVRSIERPLPTVTAGGNGLALVEPFVIRFFSERPGQCPRVHSIREPLPTVTSRGACALVEPFTEPLDTVTSKDRFGLVVDDRVLDVRFRMLQPHELAAAQGFPTGYRFSGTKQDAVKQIGNAVEVHQAEALCLALLREYAR
ncbi:MAG TPA: DNA cytosine methyltransferase [Methylomirabilota bacterium]|nr:DNA cytosine methyltransferase [Methylomirabilota bacterium]